MRVLVTGGTGFLGSALVRALLARGDVPAVLSRTAAQHTPAGATPLTGSLAAPPWDAISAFQPEAVVHAAWIATPGVYLESPENEAWRRWSRDFASRLPSLGVRHLTVLGTCIEYAVTGRPMSESDTPLAPLSPYARAKAALHQDLASDLEGSATRLAWARIFYPYGPGEHPARLASSLLARIARGEPITLKTPHSTKDYIHEDDIARALLAILDHRHAGPINVGTGEGVTVEHLARTLATLAGRPDLVQVPTGIPADPLDFVVADSRRLRSLGWTPQVALVNGLRALVDARRT